METRTRGLVRGRRFGHSKTKSPRFLGTVVPKQLSLFHGPKAATASDIVESAVKILQCAMKNHNYHKSREVEAKV